MGSSQTGIENHIKGGLVILVSFLIFSLGGTVWTSDRIAYAESVQLREIVKDISEEDSFLTQRALAMRYFNLGLGLAKKGKWAAAALEYFRSVAEDDTFAEAHTNLGVALAQQGQTTKAIPHHLRAIELNPKLAQAHLNLAVDLAHIGRYSDAWPHVHMAQDLGHLVNSEFLKLLASRLPDPR